MVEINIDRFTLAIYPSSDIMFNDMRPWDLYVGGKKMILIQLNDIQGGIDAYQKKVGVHEDETSRNMVKDMQDTLILKDRFIKAIESFDEIDGFRIFNPKFIPPKPIMKIIGGNDAEQINISGW